MLICVCQVEPYKLTYYLLMITRLLRATWLAALNSLFAYFPVCCNSPTRACKIVAAFILFSDVRTCEINAGIYFIAAFVSFICCTWNHILSRWYNHSSVGWGRSLRRIGSDGRSKHSCDRFNRPSTVPVSATISLLSTIHDVSQNKTT